MAARAQPNDEFHLLHGDLNMIRSWLGHASIETTNTYVEIDLEMKRKRSSLARNCFQKRESTVHSGSAATTSYHDCRSCSYVQPPARHAPQNSAHSGASKILQLQLIDHVIIGSSTPSQNSYFSFKGGRRHLLMPSQPRP
jgi:hypothetical protein